MTNFTGHKKTVCSVHSDGNVLVSSGMYVTNSYVCIVSCVEEQQIVRVAVVRLLHEKRKSIANVVDNAGSDKLIKMWDLNRKKCVNTLHSNTTIYSLKFQDDKLVAGLYFLYVLPLLHR
jgi:hypothetical protein